MEHKRTGLIVFGVIWILLGLLLGLMALTIVASSMATRSMPGAAPPQMMISVALLYVGVGAVFAALGIGSIMALRWARSLILVLSWMWLITGLTSLASLFVVMPPMLDTMPAEQAAAKPFVVGCMAVFVAILMIALPGVMILFYRRPKVKAAVEALDPMPRWTDQPLPLLAFSVWMVGGAACFLALSVMYKSFPLGSFMLRGIMLYAFMLAIAAWMAFVGVGAYKRMWAAWWAAIVLFTGGVVYAVTFVSKVDMVRWYQEMGMAVDPRQMAVMQSLYKTPFFIGWLIAFWTGYLVFLLYLRRYFGVQNENRMYPPST